MSQAAGTTLSAQTLREAMNRVANQRDKKAFALLFNHFADKLYGFCYSKVGEEQLAKEVAQDTLLAVWQKAHSFDADRGNVSTWVYTIARNRCFDLGRQKLSRPQLVSADTLYTETVDENQSASEALEQSCTRSQIETLLSLLPDAQKQVVTLVYLKEMSHQAAAEFLDLPVGTIKSRLRLAMEKMATKLSRQGERK
ncbi:sigma-70 family RNA polymerase sigma factor [Ferrimonas aestuarii]|nr:sigma-70 family RNA polymerase sigma factor [Ferrimonas aestuarii]